jgi:hypothetical protein
MAETNEPTLFSQLWAQVEPTILGDDASKTDRLNARTAFLSGANAVLLVAGRAKDRGGDPAVIDALRDQHHVPKTTCGFDSETSVDDTDTKRPSKT